MAIVLNVDGTQTQLNPVTVEALIEAVGGYCEKVELDDGRCMVVHEEGKVIGLPLNVEASALLAESDVYIVGPAVICTRAELKGLRQRQAKPFPEISWPSRR